MRKKGKTPEKEIAEAAERIRKKGRESLTAASDSEEWLEYLNEIGVRTTSTEAGEDFWEKVRKKILPEPEPERIPERPRLKATPVTSYRDAKGRYSKQPTANQKIVVVYRDARGRFAKAS